ncbi:MAG: tyrosine-protein phosphatase [Anaerolineales bacterium]
MLARLMKGKRFSDSLKGFMRAEALYLSTAFDTIEREYSSFEKYSSEGIGLSSMDIERFKNIYLE